MSVVDEYYIDLDERAEKMLREGEFLGKGNNGVVYLLPDNKVIKIFKEKRVCKREYGILERTENSKYFPKVYYNGTYYIVRDYVGGERLDKYIKKNGLNKEVACKVIEVIKEFERLKFTKLDIRCKDLYITEELSLMVIDPRNNYSRDRTYPRHLMKGLNKLGVLDKFLEVVKDEYGELYDEWNSKMERYLETGIK
ncbi:serine/threonine-protein kinase [uncultured Clostridium sp.]|uniref:serine/threonine-protein kinase n=1 Tax=uncultured Clostridium sp. TaxID=59620 RepID=UPI0028E64BAD|nr:serine/threonine-protein kinase [uncultured Clostridium sp.]